MVTSQALKEAALLMGGRATVVYITIAQYVQSFQIFDYLQ
jgi:hypothetical protein